MMPDGFERIEGRMYVKKHFLDIEPEDEILIGYIDDPEGKLREIFESAEKEAKKEKDLEEAMQRIRQKLQEKKYSDRVRKHADAMLHELKHCRVNHSDDSWPWNSFDFVHQCSVMMEEAGEAVRAANTLRENSKGDLLALYNELAQTGAMCLRIMEQIEDYALRNNSH